MMRNVIAMLVISGVLLGCAVQPSAPPPTGFSADAARPLDMTAISAQPLASVPSGPVSGRVIGSAPVPLSPVLPVPNPAPTAALPPSSGDNPAAIGAAAAQILRPKPSPEETQCLAQGGRWGNAGAGAAQTCFLPAKDAGKQCAKQSDCSTQCLARSGTCAPFWPIFGCTEVIQNNGAVARLCLE